jgi:hypothetical protein
MSGSEGSIKRGLSSFGHWSKALCHDLLLDEPSFHPDARSSSNILCGSI